MMRQFPGLGLILLFPLIGVVFNLFFGRRAGRAAVNFVAPFLIFLAFGVSLWAFLLLLTMPRGAALALTLWPWIEAGSFHVDIALRFDALTAVMALVPVLELVQEVAGAVDGGQHLQQRHVVALRKEVL